MQASLFTTACVRSSASLLGAVPGGREAASWHHHGGARAVSRQPKGRGSAYELAHLQVTGEVEFRFKSAWRYLPPPPKARPPPFRQPPPSAKYQHGSVELSEMQIMCPEIILESSGYPIPDPSCQMPAATVAVGTDAEKFRADYLIVNGDRATVTLEETPEGAGTPKRSATYNVTQLVKSHFTVPKEVYLPLPVALRALVFILDWSSCGPEAKWQPSVTQDDVMRAVLPGLKAGGASIPSNMRNYYRNCSYGKSTFEEANVMVLPIVPMMCSGVVSRNLTNRPYRPPPPGPWAPPPPPSKLTRKNDTLDNWWDFSKSCEISEQKAWEAAAQAYAQKLVADGTLGPLETAKLDSILKWQARRRNIYILPSGAVCGWSGYADVTCTTPTCSAYVKSEPTPGLSNTAVQVMFHESMHNYGLQHAGRMFGGRFEEYGDPTDVMGALAGGGDGLLCPNAPNMYRIGWAKPIVENAGDTGGKFGNLTVANFTRTPWLRGLPIPAASQSDANMVVVNIGAQSTAMGAVRTPFTTYFISYRVRNSTKGMFDSGLPIGQSQRVFIHAYNGSYQGARVKESFDSKPTLLASGAAGFAWQSPFSWDAINRLGGAIKVQVRSIGATEAVINVCRLTMMKESDYACYDGWDNDCDGVTDAEDKDCQ